MNALESREGRSLERISQRSPDHMVNALDAPCCHRKKAADLVHPVNGVMKGHRLLGLDRHNDAVLYENARRTTHAVTGPMMDRHLANRRRHLGDAVFPSEVEDLGQLTCLDRTHLPTLLQNHINDRLCIDHMAECVEVVEERCQVGGREVDCTYASFARLEVTPADGNVVREDISVVPGGRIFGTGVTRAGTVAVDKGEVLTRVCGSLDTRGRLDARQELVRVQLEERA